MEPKDNLTIFESRADKIVDLLDRHLATAIDLHLRIKQALWNVQDQGLAQARDLSETAIQIEQFCDLIAGRLLALGALAQANLQRVQAHSFLDLYPATIANDEGYIAILERGLKRFRRSSKQAREKAVALRDEATATLFDKLAAASDTQIWFLRAPLR